MKKGNLFRGRLKPLIVPRHLFGKWTKMSGIFLSSAFLLGAFLLALPVNTLCIREGIGGAPLAVIPITPGSQLEVEYVHSMYGVRQKEIFSIGRESVFHLEKVLFGSLAAALYYDPDPPGGLKSEDRVWVVEGSGKRYPTLTYRVSTKTNHALKVDHRTIDLSNRFSGPDGLIQVGLEKRSRLRSLLSALKEEGFIP